MRFEWDEEKRTANLQKHGIDFGDVATVFKGHTLTIEDDRWNYGEQRFVTFGVLGGQVVAVVHTESTRAIRVISIRKATRNEERNYFVALGD
jgi:uncharacterized protein